MHWPRVPWPARAFFRRTGPSWGELAGAVPRGGALAAAAAAGGAVSADWTQVQVELPAGRGPGSVHRPGGAAATTYRTLVGCGADGIILFRGPALAGRGSEIGYLRRHLPGAGRAADSLADGCTPAGGRVRVNLDGGPREAERVLRGADMRMPHRGPLRHLAQDQADLDSRLAGERAVVESAFAAIKSYRRSAASSAARPPTSSGRSHRQRDRQPEADAGARQGGERLDADAKG